MDIQKILAACDHTCLTPGAVWQEVQALIDDAVRYQTASVCISPCFVRRAAAYADGRMKICTVIGFPSGCMTTAAKVFETRDAVENGADEIDMVINVGDVKAGRYDLVEDEISRVRKACEGKVLKVIVETCLLTDDEKIRMCGVCADAGADYIKTSTGFSSGGATFADVALLKEHAPAGLKVKASGGISTLEDAERFMQLGADRLGTSRVVKLVKAMEG